jgi:hypothetical protein
MTDNIITQPLLPDTIRFNHTTENSKTEVMRITREGLWVNPDMQVDEVAQAVLNALDSQVKTLVQRAVLDERQRIVSLLMIQHEAAKGTHNYWHVAANLIQADVASDT